MNCTPGASGTLQLSSHLKQLFPQPYRRMYDDEDMLPFLLVVAVMHANLSEGPRVSKLALEHFVHGPETVRQAVVGALDAEVDPVFGVAVPAELAQERPDVFELGVVGEDGLGLWKREVQGCV